jgi:hypothetical protein
MDIWMPENADNTKTLQVLHFKTPITVVAATLHICQDYPSGIFSPQDIHQKMPSNRYSSEMKDCMKPAKHGDEEMYRYRIADKIGKTVYLVFGERETRRRPGTGTGLVAPPCT